MSSLISAIKEQIPILEYAEHCGYHPKRVGSGEYTLVENDSIRINPHKNLFIRNSTGQGGSVIDFCMFAHNCSQEEAIKRLRAEFNGIYYSEKPIVKKPASKHSVSFGIDFPKRCENGYKKVFAYLCQHRGIHQDVVSELINRKMLYEDAKFHNCIWVGYDYDGKAKFACRRVTTSPKYTPKFVLKTISNSTDKFLKSNLSRGCFFNAKNEELCFVGHLLPNKTYKNILKSLNPKHIKCIGLNDLTTADLFKKLKEINVFDNLEIKTLTMEDWIDTASLNLNDYKLIDEPYTRGDLKGSQKKIGLFIDNKSTNLFVTEAPIDAMSIMSIFKIHNMDFKKYSYLAQAGTNGIDSLIYHIQNQPLINRIYLCYDNDSAGANARLNARKQLAEIGFKGEIIDKVPINNDFNDDLNAIHNTKKQEQKLTNQPKSKENINYVIER